MGQEVVGYGAAVNDGTGDPLHVAFAKLDAGARAFTIIDKDLTAPPPTPAIGGTYIVGAAATGAWATHDGKIAVFGLASTWRFVAPVEGMTAYAQDEGTEYRYSGAAWVEVTSSGGSGTDLGWINVKTDHGAAGDGVTDDTAAIQAAIDAAALASGGTIYFPAGVYVVNGALQDPTGANAQIVLPSLDAGSDVPMSIRFVGESPPYTTLSVGRAVVEPTGGSIIKGTLNSGSGSLLGGYNATHPSNFTNVTFFAKDIRFQMPTNPVLTCLGLRKVVSIGLDNVSIDGNEYGSDATQPTTSGSYGLRVPENNNGAWTVLRNLTVAGFYNGIECYEHTDLDNSQVWYCVNAIVFAAAQNYSSRLGDVLVVNCQNVITVTGAHHFSIEQLRIEHDETAGTEWYETAFDLTDASNLGKGRITYHVVLAGTGIRNDLFTRNGGTGVVCSPVSASPLVSNNTGISGADQIANAVSLTTAEYGAITPDGTTLYVITDA